MVEKKLIEVRSQIKKRKPTFIRRHAIIQFAKLKKSGWRAPKGMGNKQRRGRKGQPITPSCGFGSPKSVKGLNRDGLLEVLVNNVKDLDKIDSKVNVAVIASTVGSKKRLDILNIAKTKKLSISNVKDLDVEISKLTKTKKVVKKKSEKVVSKKVEDETKSSEAKK